MSRNVVKKLQPLDTRNEPEERSSRPFDGGILKSYISSELSETAEEGVILGIM
jgi:hypothetical protein